MRHEPVSSLFGVNGEPETCTPRDVWRPRCDGRVADSPGRKPSELKPELQGRFPIRVEPTDLVKKDFIRILTEPKCSLTKQYAALMGTEDITVTFTEDAIDALASYAYQVNQSTQNIGDRRLYTIMERLLEELSFEAPDMKMCQVEVDAAYVTERLQDVAGDEDLSRYIL